MRSVRSRPMSVIRHRYERAIKLADEGEIEVHDWTKHGKLDAIYIHASPDWVCFRRIIFCASQLPTCQVQKNINSPIWNPINNPINSPIWNPSTNAYWSPINNAARKANNEAAARQYLEQHGATGILSCDDIDQVCNLWL